MYKMEKTAEAMQRDGEHRAGTECGARMYACGTWQLCKDDSSDNRTRYWRCSVCKGYSFHNGAMRKKYRYCPNCGAEMKEE